MNTRSNWRRRVGVIAAGTLLFGSISLTASAQTAPVAFASTANNGTPFQQNTGTALTVSVTATKTTGAASSDIRCVEVVSAGAPISMTLSSGSGWTLGGSPGTTVKLTDATGITAKDATVVLSVSLSSATAATSTLTATAYSDVGCTSNSRSANQLVSFVVPATVPGAPTGVAAAASDKRATVTWTAPVSDGGSAITSYTATSSPGGLTCTTPDATVTECTVTGLTNGTPYTFTVVATNAIGPSVPSAPSNTVTPSAECEAGLWALRTTTLANDAGCRVATISVLSSSGPVTITRNVDRQGGPGSYGLEFTAAAGSEACFTFPTAGGTYTDGTPVSVIINIGCAEADGVLRELSFVMKATDNPKKEERFFIDLTVTQAPSGDNGGGTSGGTSGGTMAMSMSCSPEPQVNVTVTCTIVNGPSDFDIIWEASYNPVFATGVVTLDGSGNGSFSFVIPAAAMGSMVGVQLVAHTGVMPLGMVTSVVPVSVPAGEGPSPLVPTSVLLASGLLLAGAGLRRRFALQG